MVVQSLFFLGLFTTLREIDHWEVLLLNSSLDELHLSLLPNDTESARRETKPFKNKSADEQIP